MGLIYQNDRRLKQVIRTFGCNFRSLQAIAEITLGQYLGAEQINDLHTMAMQNPDVLGEDCYCKAGLCEIANSAFRLLGSKKRVIQCGSIIAGRPTSWGGEILGQRDFHFTILHWFTKYRTGHFTLADGQCTELFDPHNIQWGEDLDKKGIKKILCYKIIG